MGLLAAESVFGGLSLLAGEPESGGARWLASAAYPGALIPGIWLLFSLTFSRGNSLEFLQRWRLVLVGVFALPLAITLAFREQFYQFVEAPDAFGLTYLRIGSAGWGLALLGIVAAVLVLTNVEKTFRAAVGTTRWRVKFMVLGVGIVFGARIYTLSQSLLISSYNPAMVVVNSGALLIGSALMAVGYGRNGFDGLEVYPSRQVIQKSVTILIAGGYLFVVGVLAESVAYLGGAKAFPAQAFIVLVGIAGLAALLLSDRFRIALQGFISRNFKRPEHDFRKIWSRFSQGFSGVVGVEPLCVAASRMISETFAVLSTNTLLLDRHSERFVLVSSTSRTGLSAADTELDGTTSAQLAGSLAEMPRPFDLDESEASWADALRGITPIQFPHGGHRLAARLMAGERLLGILVLSDRVNGTPFTQEELDLLECIAEELAARLLNQNLGEEVIQAREMEAFQAMSAFFVHDMKNAASSLNLTLKNLPKHYDNPEFREDALRGIAKTSERITVLTERLGSLRQNLEPKLVETDLNRLVESVIAELNTTVPGPGSGTRTDAGGRVEVTADLAPLPKVRVDREQIASVVTNLVLNAQEALGTNDAGRVTIATRHDGGRVQLTVEDNGCGMSEAFLRNSLFRPFHSTKKQGLGIGMFQARMTIEAHHGTLQVESEAGKGTTFRINLPVGEER